MEEKKNKITIQDICMLVGWLTCAILAAYCTIKGVYNITELYIYCSAGLLGLDKLVIEYIKNKNNKQ